MTSPVEEPYCSHCEARLTSVLKTVEERTLEDVAAVKACAQFKKGQLIFKEGDTPPGLFCIHQGKVKVYKTGDEGRDQIVRFAKAGDVLGYRSLISGEAYNLSAAALEDSVICCIPRATFFEQLLEDGGFKTDMFQLLSDELRRAEDQIVHLAQKPVRERLAEALLILREVYGTENGDDSPINIKLSRNELAAVVGTATETLVRAIADLKSENLVATDKKKIRILDIEGLIAVSNLRN